MNYPDSLVRHLMRSVHCSVCEASYEPEGVSVLGHQDELWFVAVRCSQCQSQGLIAALVRDGEATPAAAPDSPPAPPEHASVDPSGGPLTDADVADMHDFLAGYRGDLSKLLEKG